LECKDISKVVSTTPRPRSTTGNQQQSSIVNKSEKNCLKTEQSSASFYMATKQDNHNKNALRLMVSKCLNTFATLLCKVMSKP
jgi:hypothetical protein